MRREGLGKFKISPHHIEIILRSDFSWADQINYMVKKDWKTLHFTLRILKKNRETLILKV
jgi:hypothetical protein